MLPAINKLKGLRFEEKPSVLSTCLGGMGSIKLLSRYTVYKAKWPAKLCIMYFEPQCISFRSFGHVLYDVLYVCGSSLTPTSV